MPAKKKIITDPLILEQMRIAEMEKCRRQNLLLRTRLEELVAEERTMYNKYSKDIDARWMKFLRDEKQQTLIAEIEIIRNTFEKTLDRKNAVIAMLGTDLVEAEDQFRLALQTHLMHLGSLIDLQKRRMAAMEQQFETSLLTMRGDFTLEKEQILREHDIAMSDLLLIIKNMEKEGEVKFRSLQEEISENQETAVERLEEDRKQMQGEMSKLNDAIHTKIDARYKEFVASAQANLKDYTDKTKEDEEMTARIAAQLRKITRLQESIATWQSNLSTNTQECERRSQALKAEKEMISRYFRNLKRKMMNWRSHQLNRLKNLATDAYSCKKELLRKKDGAERILRLHDLCQKLETDREKVLGFDSCIAVSEVEQLVRQAVEEHHLDLSKVMEGDLDLFAKLFTRKTSNIGDEEGLLRQVSAAASPKREAIEGNKEISPAPTSPVKNQSPRGNIDFAARLSLVRPLKGDWTLLQKFWLKYNKVALDNVAIQRERYHLEQENQKLKQLLKQYLDGVSINNEIMTSRDANNLLITESVQGARALGGEEIINIGGKKSVEGAVVTAAEKMIKQTGEKKGGSRITEEGGFVTVTEGNKYIREVQKQLC